MTEGINLLITVRKKSFSRRFWRELGALLWWGVQERVYPDSDAPYEVLGHENFRVAYEPGRDVTDEIELVLFTPMRGPQLLQMEKEMRQALVAVARQHGYAHVYYRNRKPTMFANQA